MNVILAMVLFMVLFLYGYNVPPPVLGSILTNSPAQEAGLPVGEKILYSNDNWQYDYTSLRLNIALVHEGVEIPVYVEHPDGTREHLTVTPRRSSEPAMSFLDIGVGQSMPPQLLEGADPKKISLDDFKKI